MSPPPDYLAGQGQALHLAQEVSELVKKHGASVFLTALANDDVTHAWAILINSFIEAASKNAMVGELIYRATLFPLLRGLMDKGREQNPKDDQRDVKLLARIAYNTTKFVQDELHPKLVRPVARFEDDFPVMRSLNPRNCCDQEAYLRTIRSGYSLPWRTARDSKWSGAHGHKNATEVAKALIKLTGDDLRVELGKTVPFNSENWWQYKAKLESTFFDKRKLDDPWFDCLLTVKSRRKSGADRRGRLKSLIFARMRSMIT
jgi:hypothetical protein